MNPPWPTKRTTMCSSLVASASLPFYPRWERSLPKGIPENSISTPAKITFFIFSWRLRKSLGTGWFPTAKKAPIQPHRISLHCWRLPNLGPMSMFANCGGWSSMCSTSLQSTIGHKTKSISNFLTKIRWQGTVPYWCTWTAQTSRSKLQPMFPFWMVF